MNRKFYRRLNEGDSEMSLLYIFREGEIGNGKSFTADERNSGEPQ